VRFSRLRIRNFRNFHKLDVELGSDLVVVGENGVGKSNLIYALRLLIDPTIPDSSRHLKEEDFWDGLPRPLRTADKILISVELVDFDEDENQLAILSDHLVGAEPLTSRLTYVFQKAEKVKGDPRKESDYEFVCFGGDRPDNEFGYEVRSKIPLALLPALRDAENDIANWGRSPLRPLLERATVNVDRSALEKVAKDVVAAGAKLGGIPEIKQAAGAVNSRLERMVGDYYSADILLGLASSDADRLIRALRVFIDDGKRSISDASLGTANLLYLSLKALEFEALASEGDRAHTFVAIEEPEAHLHPHLQRLVFRDFLRARNDHGRLKREGDDADRPLSVLLTTHSPHIASITPLESLVMLRKCSDGSTEGYSTVGLGLKPQHVADLERYLDVTRGEMLFGRAVILVEGDAELYLVPVLAKLAGVDFEQLGVTVCSVGGTNFEPYVRLLSAGGLNVPLAVVTDGDPDPDGGSAGLDRIRNLLSVLTDAADLDEKEDEEVVTLARAHGLFLGEHTFEIDLFKSGRHNSMCATLAELTESGAAEKRAGGWKAAPETLDAGRFLRDIEAIGKGRFAQRLATHINKDKCPQYIRDAVSFIKDSLG
jgi:putative ATP-dependent endonuclease of the OLD family